MTKSQNAKRAMYLVLEKYLNTTSSTILADMPEFEPTFDLFTLKVKEINTLIGKQQMNITGYAAEKKEAREKLELTLLNVLNRVRNYALNVGNDVLYQKVKFKKWELARMNDASLSSYTLEIIPIITQLLPSLTTYGVTAAMLTTLADEQDAFLALTPEPRNEIANRVLLTNKLNQSIKEADVLVGKMSELVSIVEFSYPDFYSNFFTQRKIIETGTRKLSIMGIVVDEALQPLHRVLISLDDIKKSVYSTQEGHFEMKHIEEGLYTATISKPGYVTEITQLNITKGDTLKLDIVLKSVSESLKVA